VTRAIDGSELNTEYIFGLFTNLFQSGIAPGVMSLLGIPQSYHITHFVASGNTASASTIVLFQFPNLQLSLPVEINTWNIWDSNCQVTQYDVTFRYYEYLLDTLLESSTTMAGGTNTQTSMSSLTDGLASSICRIHEEYCVGGLQQYNSTDECNQFLTTQTRFGAAYELGRNTLLCRMVHQNMVPLRPSVHCAHIGPVGGGMCADDTDYAQKVEQQYFTGSFLPVGLPT
jgi:hypothetical protein